MSKYQEVEVKYPLYNENEVRQEISKLGLLLKKDNEYQCDCYYSPAHRNFLDNEIVSEWLRVRETNKGCSLNFKQWLPIGAKIQNKCNEYETKLTDVFAMKQILKSLDFQIIAIVNKKRSSWIYNSVEISIDTVEGLGAFLELEALTEVRDDQVVSVHSIFHEIIHQIKADVGDRDHRGYPYLIIEKTRRTGNVF